MGAEDFTLRECGFAEVVQFAARGKKEHAIIKDLPGTQWFEVRYRDRETVGCCGIHKGKNLARLKGDWIDPVFRGMGAYGAMHRHRLEWIDQHLDVPRVEIITVGPPEHYARVYGFEFIKTARSGGAVLSLSADRLASFLGRS